MARKPSRKALRAIVNEIHRSDLTEYIDLRDSDTRQFLGSIADKLSGSKSATVEQLVQLGNTYANLAKNILANYDLDKSTNPSHDPDNDKDGYRDMFRIISNVGDILPIVSRNGQNSLVRTSYLEQISAYVEADDGLPFELQLVPRFVTEILDPKFRTACTSDVETAMNYLQQQVKYRGQRAAAELIKRKDCFKETPLLSIEALKPNGHADPEQHASELIQTYGIIRVGSVDPLRGKALVWTKTDGRESQIELNYKRCAETDHYVNLLTTMRSELTQ